MGADGHIYLFKPEDLERELGKELFEKLLKHGSARVYLQELDGKKYVSYYFGDSPPMYDAFDVEELMGWRDFTEEEAKKVVHVLHELSNVPKTHWEVWT